MNSTNKSKAELRKYGLVMAAAFLVLALLLLWRGKDLGYSFFAVACVFISLALGAPNLLGPVERIWMAFAERLSVVMTTVIMFVVFFLVITPVGLLLRLFRKDLLALKLDKGQPTYWVKVEADGPGSRPYLPY